MVVNAMLLLMYFQLPLVNPKHQRIVSVLVSHARAC